MIDDDDDFRPAKYENDTAHLYEEGREYGPSGFEGLDRAPFQLDFYKSQVYQLFELYLEGSLTLEEFVEYRSWPKDAIKEVGLRPDIDSKYLQQGPILSMRGPKPGYERSPLKEQVMSIKQKGKLKEPSNFHKEYIRNLLKGFVRSKSMWKSRNGEVNIKRKEVMARIAKLRRFMFEKMQQQRTQHMKESNIDSFKIYDIIMNIANETLVKLQNKNMIDSFDMTNFMIKQQKSPVFLSDMNIRSKQYGERSKQTYTERYTDIVNLKKFINDIKYNKSTHSDMVKTVFNQISDRYYKHLRPATPEKSISNGDKKQKENSKTDQIHLPGAQSQPSNATLNKFETPKKINNSRMDVSQNLGMTSFNFGLSKTSIDNSDDVMKQRVYETERKKTSSNFRISKNDTRSKTILKPFNKQTTMSSYMLAEVQKEKKAAHLGKATFSSKMKTNLDNRNVQEYHYFKEKKLLQYLKLEGKSHLENRNILEEKIKKLETTYKQIDDDKINLLTEINAFNPLDINEMRRYIEATRNYSVTYTLLSTI